MKMIRGLWFIPFLLLASCAVPPAPHNVNNICYIFKQYPRWHRASLDVERRWRVPVAVQMAIIHQESKFNAKAKPPRGKLLNIVPWKRPSSAYGYTQALDGTWALYKQSASGLFASRESFTDGVDFIGWYANLAYKKAGILRSDPYALYLAYHEGVTGFQRKTYLRKPWLIHVARKVKLQAQLYQQQLKRC